MKYRYIFFLTDGGHISIDTAAPLDLECEWLTLSTKEAGGRDTWHLHLMHVTRINKVPLP